MKDKVFLDTNIWVYLFSNFEPSKQLIAKQLIREKYNEIILSTQVLNELFNALSKKKILSSTDASETISLLIRDFPIVNVTPHLTERAIKVHIQSGYSFYDSLILATADFHDCTILYSEDMQNNQILFQGLKIKNPFL